MAENKIQYSARNYNDVRNGILSFTQRYYSDLFHSFNDASVGLWLVDLVSDTYDALSYSIDRTYQETSMDSAQSRSSLLQIARNNGVRIPGPKCAIVEIELSCELPVNTSLVQGTSNDISVADESYAPYIRRGCLFSSGNATFELMEDVDFKTQFDSNGISNRQIYPKRNSNGKIVSYVYKKLAICTAGQSKVYKRTILARDIEPFMSIEIPDNNATNIESIILKQGTVLSGEPKLSEFYVDKESYEDTDGKPVLRYFEVDNLCEQYRFGYEEEESESADGTKKYYNPVWEIIDGVDLGDGTIEPVRLAMRGKWKRLKNKFISEFSDKGMLRVVFGPGIRNKYGQIPNDAKLFTQYMMSRMEANDYMGVLPEPNTTMYILYRTGGGEITNVSSNTVKNIVYLNMDIDGNCDDPEDNNKKIKVRRSIAVTNPTPSYGGKDAPSNNEIRYLTKYNTAAQNRCVTVRDYYAKLMEIHPKYGCPFRTGVVEENNKVVIYTLGLNYLGNLTTMLAETVANNMKEYLSNFKMINDFVEIRSGRIINVAFEIDVFIDKSYDRNVVTKNIIEMVTDYMDIRKHQMGEDIFIGDLEKEISKMDGVVNLIGLRCYNKVGNGYSENESTQEIVEVNDCNYQDTAGYDVDTSARQINLQASDKVLLSDVTSMFEIRYPAKDIRVNVKVR